MLAQSHQHMIIIDALIEETATYVLEMTLNDLEPVQAKRA